ncbi:hypothetical protein Cni_G03309 [Canna indica]|uniref:EXPERA domain-containing protein n=1 Tax=Canna indica TaxID=4628 RepID=A0AAQ3JTA0_9LILI|nr:hypothetical protein Cni_G03309 [Canna indica]
MEFIRGLVDAVVILFSGVVTVVVSMLNGQVCLPEKLYSAPLTELKRWYDDKYDDYLLSEKPHFFTDLIWLELVFLWPLSLANVYGILAGRPWAATTSLMAGVSHATSMAAILSELLGSWKASDQLHYNTIDLYRHKIRDKLFLNFYI